MNQVILVFFLLCLTVGTALRPQPAATRLPVPRRPLLVWVDLREVSS